VAEAEPLTAYRGGGDRARLGMNGMSANHSSRPEAERQRAFLSAYPAYAQTSRLDELRRTDYARLDRLGHTYLDFTGGGLYAESQVRRHYELLRDGVLGNPHSHNPTSLASTELVERVRKKVLDYFRADGAEYDVVFTPNASGALKLVGESYPFAAGSTYLLSYDNHNSVNGVREFARRGGACVSYLPVRLPDLRLDGGLVTAALERATPGVPNLFAFPAQSNFSGVQHPLEWVEAARRLGWHVILDCAAFAPTNRLDLSAVRPDFVPLSFYKMFGYPTGVGALIARREALAKLRRPWFAGGTITVASVQGEGWHHLAPGHMGFEDGTVDYLGLPAVEIGLEHLEDIGIELIHERVMALTGWLLGKLTSLSHSNGKPMAQIFGPVDRERRGGTIAFYLLDLEGVPYDVERMESLAGTQRISIRTGCFCNPGDGEVAHHITRDEMAGCFVGKQKPVTFQECYAIIHDTAGKVPNTMRVSLGLVSNFADVERFLAFVRGFRDLAPHEVHA
jgi:selenocysteine lyase/cysteine desulfurase